MMKRGGTTRDETMRHRGGVPYEAEIYKRVLQPLGVSVPEFIGAETDSNTGETTLYLGFVDEALRLDNAEFGAVVSAARWIGQFHGLNERRVKELEGIVNPYDAEYYLKWAELALEFNRHRAGAWLSVVCAHFPDLVTEMLHAPATLIHGEYYPKNILANGEWIVPVDWESAAIGMGEIDLASLLEGWANEYCQTFKDAYQCARWPDGVPHGFERRIVLAGIYWIFRWLGDPLNQPTGVESVEYFTVLKRLAEEVEVL